MERFLLGVMGIVVSFSMLSGCKEEANCTDTSQCANGFVCNTGSSICEASADASPEEICPAATHQCLPALSPDWDGPRAIALSDLDTELPSCPTAYGDGARDLFADFEATGACSCTCSGTASGVTCTNASIEERETIELGCAIDDCLGDCSISVGPNSCEAGTINGETTTNFSAWNNVAIKAGKVTNSGNCGDPAESSDFDSGFLSQARLCAPPQTSFENFVCPEEGVCAPLSDEQSYTTSCVSREGEHACPTGYDNGYLYFKASQDTRSCSGCSCGGPEVDSSCGGSVLFIADSDCSPAIAPPSGSVNSCIANPLPGDGSVRVNYASNANNFSCEVATPSTESGSAEGTNPVTVCCTVALE